MIDDLVNQVDNWDQNTLVNYVKDTLMDSYTSCSTEDIIEAWQDACVNPSVKCEDSLVQANSFEQVANKIKLIEDVKNTYVATVIRHIKAKNYEEAWGLNISYEADKTHQNDVIQISSVIELL